MTSICLTNLSRAASACVRLFATQNATIGLMNTEERSKCVAAAWTPVKVLAVAWILVTAFAVFAYAATVSSPTLSHVDWHDAARAGTSILLLSTGGSVDVGEASITLMPLSVTLLIWWFLYRSFLKFGVDSWAQAGSAAASSFLFTLVTGVTALPGAGRFVEAFGAAVVTTAAMARAHWKLFRPQGRAWDVVERSRSELIPAWRALAVIAAGFLALALVLGRSTIATINGYYVQGVMGTLMLTLVQLAYLPNLLVWGASYMLGAGFSIGQGTSFSALGVKSLQLPAIPVFGALPGPDVRMTWLPITVAFLAFGWFVWKSRRYSSLREASLTGAACFAAIVVVGGAVSFLSSGGVGPGRMADVGPSPLALALDFALTLGIPCILGLVGPRAIQELRSRDRKPRENAEEPEEGERTVMKGFSSPPRFPGKAAAAKPLTR